MHAKHYDLHKAVKNLWLAGSQQRDIARRLNIAYLEVGKIVSTITDEDWDNEELEAELPPVARVAPRGGRMKASKMRSAT